MIMDKSNISNTTLVCIAPCVIYICVCVCVRVRVYVYCMFNVYATWIKTRLNVYGLRSNDNYFEHALRVQFIRVPVTCSSLRHWMIKMIVRNYFAHILLILLYGLFARIWSSVSYVAVQLYYYYVFDSIRRSYLTP